MSAPGTISAGNRIGYGIAAAVARTTNVAIGMQTTPAPVSTSHYLRNLKGVASHDVLLLKSMGATDAGYNPSGHRYLVLQDIGAHKANAPMLLATSTNNDGAVSQTAGAAWATNVVNPVRSMRRSTPTSPPPARTTGILGKGDPISRLAQRLLQCHQRAIRLQRLG